MLGKNKLISELTQEIIKLTEKINELESDRKNKSRLYALDEEIKNKTNELERIKKGQEVFENGNIMWCIKRLINIQAVSKRETKKEKADLIKKINTFLKMYKGNDFKTLDDFIALIADLIER
jgi:phenylpyruvate tautomerase PptA (4-oxalocrotonate tautomerase family)